MTTGADSHYAYVGAEALVRSCLGRPLEKDREHPLMRAARKWLTDHGCERQNDANKTGAYLVTDELDRAFRTDCWPKIKHKALRV
ncbi:MAG: hypothetical protein U0R50_12985 [Gaiellales bacterium]